MYGLLIVSRTADGTASAALLYDEKSRFGTSEPAMMEALAAVWQPLASDASRAAKAPGSHTTVAAPPPAHLGAVPQLSRATGGDGSAVIDLPAG